MSQKLKDATIPTIPLNARFSRWFGRNLLRIYMIFGFTYLFIPVAYTFAFSFNDSGKSNLIWKGFTLSNWQNPCGAPEVCNALGMANCYCSRCLLYFIRCGNSKGSHSIP